jgi:probable phosphoglycerate mutase
MCTEVILIRHGNAVRVNGAYRNVPLTPLGQQRSARTGQHLRQEHLPLAAFYSSPLRRARETANIIGAAIGETAAVEDGLREMETAEVPVFLLFEGVAVLDPADRYLNAHVGRPLRWPFEGRVSRVLAEIVAAHPNQCVAVVAHAEVIPAAVTGRATVFEWKCDNGKPSVVKQVFTPDEQGFLKDFWYRLTP